MSLRAAMSELPDFVWCPTDCGAGQLHETGTDQPIVTCIQCQHKYCFIHGVAWHRTLSCAEYDALRADPVSFQSRAERLVAGNQDLQPEDRALLVQMGADHLLAMVSGFNFFLSDTEVP